MVPINAQSLTADTQDPLVTQLLHFAKVIRGEEAPLVTGLEGLRSLEVVEAVAQSAEQWGRSIRRKPEQHTSSASFCVTKKYPIVLKISCKNG